MPTSSGHRKDKHLLTQYIMAEEANDDEGDKYYIQLKIIGVWQAAKIRLLSILCFVDC